MADHQTENRSQGGTPDVVAALSSDLEDVEGMEKLSEIFRGTIKNCGEEMKQELERVNELKARIEAGEDVGSHTTVVKNSRAGGRVVGWGIHSKERKISRLGDFIWDS